MSLEARVKEELESDGHHVPNFPALLQAPSSRSNFRPASFSSQELENMEVDLNNDADWLKVEFEDVTQEPMSVVKQEEEWGNSAGLYVDHELKEEVVLGPESLQRTDLALVYGTSSGRPRGTLSRAALDAAAEQKSAPPLKMNTGRHRSYVEINTYMCDICGKLFTAKNNLIRHIKVHLKNNTDKQAYITEKEYSCKLCDKSFKQSGHLNRHVRHSHAAAAPLCVVCKICQKGFTRLESLRLHKMIHTGQKPYSCQICEKKFTQIGNLSRHTRIHTGEKPHACDICSRRFTQSCDLKKHMRIHTGDKPYPCDACGGQFTCSGDLRKHKRTAGHKRTLSLQKKTYKKKVSFSAADCIK